MKTTRLLQIQWVLVFCLGLFATSLYAAEEKKNNFVGCTPGDQQILVPFGIPLDTKVDFIKWDLVLDNPSLKNFTLKINFGESQPNTLGFINGGQQITFKGNYQITRHNGLDVFQLTSPKFQQKLSMTKLNENLFHLMTMENTLMVGNGGWSYMLNNQNPIKIASYPAISTTYNDRSIQTIYEGRTPCQELAVEHNMSVSDACFKLKWKLILNRDPISFEPTTYSIRKIVDNVPRDSIGNWTILKEKGTNNLFYQLDPDKPAKTMSLLVADENILYFLHKDKQLYIGNENFSYTLNKKELPLNGAWLSKNGTEEQVCLFVDGYATETIYSKEEKKFLETRGGPYRIEGNKCIIEVEFDTKDQDQIGRPLSFEYSLNKNEATFQMKGKNRMLQKIEEGTGPLYGLWTITGRMQEGKIVPIQRTGTRKTVKILSGSRFQWIAIDPGQKLFSGTGGGTYEFSNGKYVEHIEFFSRDSSRVGASLSFDGKLENGDWHHSGLSSKGDKIYEIWGKFKNQ